MLLFRYAALVVAVFFLVLVAVGWHPTAAARCGPGTRSGTPRVSLTLTHSADPFQRTPKQKALKALVKKYNKNINDRLKYGSSPEKFYESELELAVALDGLSVGTEGVWLYQGILGEATDGDEWNDNEGIVAAVMGLLQHENGDIAARMISLLSELTDADESEDADVLNPLKGALISLLIGQQLLKVLLHALTSSLDESRSDEEGTAVYQVLSILENLVDLNPDDSIFTASTESDWIGILEYLARHRLPAKRAQVDSNAQYASEILAIILQSGGAALRKRFVKELDGVDVALRALAGYRSTPPETPEQTEFLENMFDVLCALLMEDEAKGSFLGCEGVELMLLFLRGRTVSRTAALKCLDFATTRCGAAADVCVEKGLLGLLFAVFMGRSSFKGKKRRERAEAGTQEEEEVRCVSILSNLFVGLSSPESTKDSPLLRQRLVGKFVEKECEKCQKLVEIMVVFAGRVASEEARIRTLFGGEDEEEVKEEVLLAKMDAGLFTVQQCALVLAELWAEDEFALRKGILTMLHEKELTLKYLEMTLTGYVESLGGGEETKKTAKAEKQHAERVRLLIKGLNG